MADTRIAVSIKPQRANEWATTEGAALFTRIQADLVVIRDRFRNAFAGPRYKVSDIAKWQGLTSNNQGYAFILRDTSENHEWLFLFGGTGNGTTSYFSYYIGNNNGATLSPLTVSVSTSTSTSPIAQASTQVSMCIHYNPDYATATYQMGFNDTTELTYTGGDFTAPGTSPYSALATFLPANLWKIYSFQLTQGTINRSQFTFIYDPDMAVMCVGQQQNQLGSYLLMYSGELFPLNADGGLSSPTDTHTRGILVQGLGGSTSDMTYTLSISPAFISFRRENGTWEQHTGRITNSLNNFTRDNYKNAGQVQYRKLRVEIPSTLVKGYLDPRIAVEAFPDNDSAYLNAALEFTAHPDKPLIKCHRNLCYMWKKDYPFVGHFAQNLADLP